MSKYSHPFKLLILGDDGVGKTSILRQFAENKFEQNNM